MEKRTIKCEVYDVFSKKKVFEGSDDAARAWILDKAECIGGRRLFSFWEEEGVDFYDVERIYKVVRK